jgi:hypothetical protein
MVVAAYGYAVRACIMEAENGCYNDEFDAFKLLNRKRLQNIRLSDFTQYHYISQLLFTPLIAIKLRATHVPCACGTGSGMMSVCPL